MNPGLIVKLRPISPWRVGPESGARNRVDAIYHSDSLYSAVTLAMSRLGVLDAWLDATARSSRPSVCFSSCFPLVDDRLLVAPPRTVWPPSATSLASGRVRWKSARFVPIQIVRDILSGKQLDENRWTLDGPSGCLMPHGKPGPFLTSLRWSAAIDRLSGAAERHAVACVEFRPGAGLWTVASFADEAARKEWRDRVKGAFRWLADSGFGGERSRGWGRTEAPEFREGPVADLLGVGNVPKTMASTPIAQTPGGPDVIPPVQEPPQEEPPVTEPPSEPQLPEPDPDPDPLPPNEPEPVPAFGTAEASSEAPQETSAEPLETAAQLTPSEIAPLLAPAEDPRPTEESTQSNEAFAGAAQASESDGVEASTTEAPSIDAPPIGNAPPAEAPIQESAPAASPDEASSHEASPIETAAQLTPPEIAPLLAPAEDLRPTEESTQSNEAFAGDAQASGSDDVEASTTEAPAIEAPPTGDAPPAEAPVQESAPAASPNEASSHEASPIETSLNEAEPNGIAQAPLETQPELPVAQAAPGEPAPKPPSQNLAPHWLLSLFSPAAADTVEWSRGNYSLIERGGRVESPAGSGALKKQVRMVAEGSVLYAGSALHGAAPDVAPDGFAHPVFRAGFALAIPLPEVR